jgi:hypothetical protein
MKILKEGIVYRVNEGPFRYQAWPSVAQDENGVLYAVCSGHRSSHVCPFGKNLMFTSTDGGESWSVPSIINDTWLDDRDAGITYLGNGRMILSWFNHPAIIYRTIWRNWIVGDAEDEFKPLVEGFLEGYKNYTPEQDRAGSFIRISDDYGKSWGDPIKTVVSAPHGPVKTVSGRLLYVGREFPGLPGRYSSQFKAPDDNVPMEDRSALFLYESFDGGESWELVSKLPIVEGVDNEKLCEPHLVETPDGEIIVAIRAHVDAIYDNFTVYFRSSKDGGKSWSEPWNIGTAGSPPHLLLRKDGSVLVTYARRSAPFGIRAKVSYDGCRTFSEEYVLSDARNGDLGYPATTELADGSLVTVFYQPYKDDLRTSILYTKWEI